MEKRFIRVKGTLATQTKERMAGVTDLTRDQFPFSIRHKSCYALQFEQKKS